MHFHSKNLKVKFCQVFTKLLAKLLLPAFCCSTTSEMMCKKKRNPNILHLNSQKSPALTKIFPFWSCSKKFRAIPISCTHEVFKLNLFYIIKTPRFHRFSLWKKSFIKYLLVNNWWQILTCDWSKIRKIRNCRIELFFNEFKSRRFYHNSIFQ